MNFLAGQTFWCLLDGLPKKRSHYEDSINGHDKSDEGTNGTVASGVPTLDTVCKTFHFFIVVRFFLFVLRPEFYRIGNRVGGLILHLVLGTQAFTQFTFFSELSIFIGYLSVLDLKEHLNVFHSKLAAIGGHFPIPFQSKRVTAILKAPLKT